MQSETPTTPLPTATQILDLLVIFFSAVVISGINIIVSGHILGTVLALSRGGDNYFRIPLWPILNVRVRGSSLIAGLSAFAISLLSVGLFWTDSAKTIFITNMQATDKPLTACELLATLISVLGCVVIATVAWAFQQLKGAVRKVRADNDQVDKILEDDDDD